MWPVLLILSHLKPPLAPIATFPTSLNYLFILSHSSATQWWIASNFMGLLERKNYSHFISGKAAWPHKQIVRKGQDSYPIHLQPGTFSNTHSQGQQWQQCWQATFQLTDNINAQLCMHTYIEIIKFTYAELHRNLYTHVGVSTEIFIYQYRET